jgi:octaprenyl-diphosphate synthase
VLVGDYLLSRGLLMSVDKGEFQLLRIVSNAVKEMSEGELLQQEKSRLLNITEEVYYDIIRQKTASLIAACCQSGAAASGASDEDVQRMYEFGLNVGLAFQIKDDLLDYGFGEKIGKPIGIDIKERKLTLPLIVAMRNAGPAERSELMRIIKKHNTDGVKVKQLVSSVIALGGIEYAAQQMNHFRDLALQSLNHFAESPAKTALADLVHYTINRKK